MNEIPYTLTNESVTVIYQGKPYTVQKTAANFLSLRKAILDGAWADIPNHLTAAKSLQEWLKGKFTIASDNKISFENRILPHDFSNRIHQMAARGEDPSPLLKFWERLQKNPSWRSVEQLWSFLNRVGIPLTEDGCFMAYKKVREDFMDVHSGKILNKIGDTIDMPRNQISDDPNHACHEGLHVGALEYAQGFVGGGNIIICKIDPENVVCVPYDCNQQKMRVCKYIIVGHHNGELMPDTTIPKEDYDEPDDHDEHTYSEEDDGDDTEDSDICSECGCATEECECEDAGDEEEEKREEPEKVTKPDMLKQGAAQYKHDQMQFAEMDKLGMKELMEKQIHQLRWYATHRLKIVGASKIPGGKTALVSQIMKHRARLR